MKFEDVLGHIKAGKRASRQGWNGKGMWVAAQFPDKFSKMQRPYCYIRTGDGTLVPWSVSPGDLFAEDWFMVE